MRAIARLHRARPFTYLWVSARLEAMALRRADGVLCLTRHSLREAEGLARRAWLLPNAVDPVFFQVQRRPALKPYLVCPANIVALKNHLRLIEALAPLAATHALTLVFAGGGDVRDPYFNQFREVVAQNSWCRHEGFWNRSQLLEGLSRATLVVLPSLEDNCPMALLEAMAAGVPVAAARVGGIPDIIEEDVTGVLFDPRNPGDMRRCLQNIMDNSTRREKMAEVARQRMAQRHSPAVVAAGHLAIYRELLQARP
jgi:glycosyltransferase involved in cell wall biosynthesis